MSQRRSLDTQSLPIWKYRSSLPKSDLSSPLENKDRILREGGGILLWGPPGCGKSSGKAHIINLLGVDSIVIFDSDDFNEYTIKLLFPEIYDSLCSEKHNILKLKDTNPSLFHTQIEEFFVKESQIKIEIGRAKFSEFPSLIAKYRCNPTKPLILANIFFLIKDYLRDRFYMHLEPDTYDEFIQYWTTVLGHPHPDQSLDVRDTLFRFGVYYCKKLKKPFVLETTGKTYDSTFLQWCFGDIPNILYMPFIYDFSALMKRVKNRFEQFGNPPQSWVETAFQNAYGKNLQGVLDMNLFEQIIIQGNNLVNYVMMSLEKVEGKGYILVKEFANDVHEAEYIKLVLGSLFIPPHLHHHSEIVYDMERREWHALYK